MQALLGLSRAIDGLNTRIARAVFWLVLVVTFVSSGNALVRYSLGVSSNAWLELQWYLFAAVFLFCAPYTLLRNEMVRIDVIVGRLSARTQSVIDILGTLFFLLPMTIGIGWLSWPVFVEAFQRHEMSSNAGGLIVWPARLMIPVGMALMAAQGLSQLIKLVAFLRGEAPDPNEKGHEKSAEELLAEEIARMRGDAA
jgi:TRAP-type mannitol/chloroaromatic compound transport system permease small subunit